MVAILSITQIFKWMWINNYNSQNWKTIIKIMHDNYRKSRKRRMWKVEIHYVEWTFRRASNPSSLDCQLDSLFGFGYTSGFSLVWTEFAKMGSTQSPCHGLTTFINRTQYALFDALELGFIPFSSLLFILLLN